MDGGGGDLSLKVRVTPVIDQSKLKGEAKKVETQLNKNIKFMGSFKGVKGASGGGGTGNAAVAGAIGGIFASLTQGVMGALHKMTSMMVESSGMLKGVLKMLNMGFMQILRPIGDVLAMLLRPVAMFFRVIGREIMKRMRAKRNELKAQGLKGSALGWALMEEMPGIYLDVFIEQLGRVDWVSLFLRIGNFLWTMFTEKLPLLLSKLNSLGGLILILIIGAIGTMLVLGTLAGLLLTGIFTAIGPMMALGGLGGGILSTATTAIGTMGVLAGLGAIIFAIAEVALWAASDDAQKTYDRMTSAQDMPAGAPPLPEVAGGNVGYINVNKPGASPDTLVSNLKKEAENLYNMVGGHGQLIPGLAGGGEVLGTGLVNMHAGEVAADKGNLRQLIAEAVSVNNSNTIVIPGSVISDAIDRRIDYYYQTKVANRR